MNDRVLRHFIRQARCVVTLALSLALTIPVQADDPSPALRAAVKELAEEAIVLIRNQETPKGAPDYATRCQHDVTQEDISMALTLRTHREPFVDAYVRWQLTSFDAPLPEMNEQEFAKFMDLMPEMVENPRANEQVVALYERADEAGELNQRDLAALQENYNDLQVNSTIAELANRPGVEFREFVAEKIGETGVKARLWLLEECVATIRAGWSTRSVKTRISKSFLAASNEADFPREHLSLLAAQTKKLADLNRRFVSDLTVYVDGRVDVSFSTAGVTEQDVEKWVNRLAGVP